MLQPTGRSAGALGGCGGWGAAYRSRGPKGWLWAWPGPYELARRAGAPLPATHGRFEKPETEFDDPLLSGNTVRADLALVEHVDDRPRRGFVLEVQLAVDLDKQWTTVLYRAGLRRRYRCPAWVIWFSPDEKVRASVADSMFEDEPELRPLVVTPSMIPIVLDLDEARTACNTCASNFHRMIKSS